MAKNNKKKNRLEVNLFSCVYLLIFKLHIILQLFSLMLKVKEPFILKLL